MSFHLWIPFVITAQLAWACGNYLDKHLIDRFGIGTQLIVSGLFGVIVAVAILAGLSVTDNFGKVALLPIDIAQSLFIGMLEIVWLVPYFYALRDSDETESAPLFQSVPVFALVLGVVSFGEVPPIWHIVGAFTIIGGALVLNWNFGLGRLNRRVVILMLGSSLIVALTAFLFKDAALGDNFWGVSFWMACGMCGTGLLMWFLIPPYRDEFRGFLSHLTGRKVAVTAGNELVDTVALMAFNAALVLGPSVMVVQATLGYQPLFILAIGLILARLGSKAHREGLAPAELLKKGMGIALLVLGSIFVYS